jgi:hypothetical protein
VLSIVTLATAIKQGTLGFRTLVNVRSTASKHIGHYGLDWLLVWLVVIGYWVEPLGGLVIGTAVNS